MTCHLLFFDQEMIEKVEGMGKSVEDWDEDCCC